MALRRGLSLVELLVAVAIIGVLLGLLLPAVQRVRAAAARASCANKLRQITIACHTYEGVYGRFPPAVHRPVPGDSFYHMSWLARILPYLDQSPLWNVIEQDYRANAIPFRPIRHQAIGTVVPSFVCPADSLAQEAYPVGGPLSGLSVAFTSYLGKNAENADLMSAFLRHSR